MHLNNLQHSVINQTTYSLIDCIKLVDPIISLDPPVAFTSLANSEIKYDQSEACIMSTNIAGQHINHLSPTGTLPFNIDTPH